MKIITPPSTDSRKVPRRIRVLVTGSRDWRDQQVIYDALDRLASGATVTVVHGACPSGADYWANRWAVENVFVDHLAEPHPADWKRNGKVAGRLRNVEMTQRGADLCLAFILNSSNGATHCAREAVSAGIPTIVFRQTYPDLTQIADALALSASPGPDGEGE